MLNTKHNIIAIVVLGIALAVVVVVVGGISWRPVSAPVIKTTQNTPSTPVASSTPVGRTVKPHPPHGPVTYQVAEAATQLPGFVQATIDPADAAVGQVQHFTVVTNDTNPVVSVVATITTDHKTITIPLVSKGVPAVSLLVPRTFTVDADNTLALVAPGTGELAAANTEQGAHIANAATANDTEFTGQWTVEDTHTARYKTVFTAKDSVGNENSVAIGWTDPLCPFTSVNNYNGATSTVTTSCQMTTGSSISPIDGPEHGNLMVGSGGILAINASATLVINSGYKIAFSGNGYITIVSGGTAKIVFGKEMCGADNDGDHYISGAGWTATSSCGAMSPRTAITVGGVGDCNDLLAYVKPLQSAFFYAPAVTNMNLVTHAYDGGGESNYDYNCDGYQTQQYIGNTTVLVNGGCVAYNGDSGDCPYLPSYDQYWYSATVPACGVSGNQYVYQSQVTSCGYISYLATYQMCDAEPALPATQGCN